MANCTSCSAPLPDNSITCIYCGSRNDVDLQGVHYYTTHDTDSQRICPRCNIPLVTINLQADGRFYVERCDECLGLFFDPGELEALLQATVTNVFVINRQQLENLNAVNRLGDNIISYVKCPVCCKMMNRVNFGSKSGVVVDRCREHGVWLDSGELRSLSEWVKAGGQLLDKERREERQREAEQLATRQTLQYGSDRTAKPELFDGVFRRDESDLLDSLIRVVGRIILS